MKRTINEIYNLINKKIENASNDFERTVKIIENHPNEKEYYTPHFHSLRGEIDAYTDIKILIETSEVLEDE